MPVVVCLKNPGTAGITLAGYAYGSSIDDIDIPAETLTGDVTYIIAYSKTSGDFDDVIPAPPAGWTTVSENSNFRIYRKIWTGAVSFLQIDVGSAGEGIFLSLSFRGAHQTTPEDVAATTATGSGMPNCPSITTVTDNAWVLAFGGVADDVLVPFYPSGYENTIGLRRGGTDDYSLLFCSKIKSLAGAEDPGAFSDISGASGSWRGITVAVRPA